MPTWILIVLMVIGGAAIAIQPPLNASLAEKTGYLPAATISFAVGAVVLLILSLVSGEGSFRRAADADWWQLCGGLLGAFFVTMSIVAVPRIGITAVLALTIVFQLITGLVMDHYGMLGMRVIPVDFKRLLGVAFLLAGLFLVYRR